MTDADATSRDLYSILGIEKTDPSGAVHEAFIEKIPRHPPDKDPEGFKALTLAYNTLMDPRAREEYDNLLSCGEDIAILMNQAFDAMVRGRLKRAEQLVRRIVDETGGASEAMMLLGMVQFEQGLYHDAVNTMGELVDRFPRVPLYRINLGNMLMNRYRNIETSEAKEHVLKRAREQYEKAIELDDQWHLAYIEMSKSFDAEGDPETAYEWTEKAVRADGREDFEDFDALLQGCMMLAQIGDPDRLCGQVLRLERVVQDDEEARAFASTAFVHRTVLLVHERRLEATRELLLAATRLTPDRKDLKGLLADTELALEADGSWADFKDDPGIIPPMKAMADQFFQHFLLRTSGDRLDLAGHDFFNKLDSWSIDEIRGSLDRMKRMYPAIWELNRDFWQSILNLAHGRASVGNYSSTFMIVLTIIIAALIVGAFWLLMLHYG